MFAHHLVECGEIGRTAGCGVEDRCDFAEVVGTEDARCHDRECLRVDVAGVVELMDGAAGG